MAMFKSLASAAVAPTSSPTNPEDATKQALLAVVQVWLDRLSAMSVVTSFFVSIDSMLYSFPARPDSGDWSTMDTLILASLGGAIILHVCASILAYCGSFVLIRYRLNDAEKTEKDTESAAPKPSVDSTRKQFRAGMQLSPGPVLSATSTPTEFVRDITWDAYTDLRSLISVSQVHPFAWLCDVVRKAGFRKDPEAQSGADDAVVKLKSMVLMLTRVHTVTVIMAVLGFILALLGTIAYFWTELPRALGIFASACLGGCLLAGTVAVL